ncbi:hypothetical protein Taro_034846 [Colocasia esculenta]|uniref:Uncharacterized protein n=1 Tax=Colocasia esculenta TaxID=4460 RepID=A0A843VYU7_COLES|nr:hypothetical protein [Colocasia esculenta]
MGWSHPGISLEDLLRLIKGFVDILILASGYRSSGLPASWDAENIKKAISWGAFFENLFSHLSESEEYEVLVKELDEALLELTSSSSFPQGLKCLSSETLSRARFIVLEFFSQNLSLGAGHLNALLNASVETDLHDLAISDAVGINLYIEKLTKQVKSHDVITVNGLFVKDSATKPEFPDSSKPKGLSVSSSVSATNASDMKTKQRNATDHSSFIIQELLKRQASVSCLSSCEESLDSFQGLIVGNNFSDVELELLREQPCDAILPSPCPHCCAPAAVDEVQ